MRSNQCPFQRDRDPGARYYVVDYQRSRAFGNSDDHLFHRDADHKNAMFDTALVDDLSG